MKGGRHHFVVVTTLIRIFGSRDFLIAVVLVVSSCSESVLMIVLSRRSCIPNRLESVTSSKGSKAPGLGTGRAPFRKGWPRLLEYLKSISSKPHGLGTSCLRMGEVHRGVLAALRSQRLKSAMTKAVQIGYGAWE